MKRTNYGFFITVVVLLIEGGMSWASDNGSESLFLKKITEGKNAVEKNDVTDKYLINADFDEDLTFQIDGTMKTAVSTETSLSSRSWAYISEDNTVYARPKSSSSQSRPDGRKMDAVNGFIGQIKGWTVESSSTFPNCEWMYFGNVPYGIAMEAVPISDDSDDFLYMPEKPIEFGNENNVAATFFRAGWGAYSVYKQSVRLPAGTYELNFWTCNINNNSSSTGINLCQVSIEDVDGDMFTFADEKDFRNTEWLMHTIKFDVHTESAEVVIQLGFKAENSSSLRHPCILIDGVKLYSIFGDEVEKEVPFVEGEYYLKTSFDADGDGTAETYFLGGANNWGTRAALIPNSVLWNFEHVRSNIYHLDSYQSNGGNNHYLNSNGFVDSGVSNIFLTKDETDGTFMLSLEEEGNYLKFVEMGCHNLPALGFGGDATDAIKFNVVASSAEIQAGDDITYLIRNANFDTNNRWGGHRDYEQAWTVEAANYNLRGGESPNMCAESWHSAFTICQTLYNVPNGLYVLGVQAAVRDDAGLWDGANYPVAFINEATAPFIEMENKDYIDYVIYRWDAEPYSHSFNPSVYSSANMSDFSQLFADGQYKLTVPVLVTDNTITLGVKGSRTNMWAIWDNFTLTYKGIGDDWGTPVIVDYTDHIQNPGFDEDISFNVDGSAAKPYISSFEWEDMNSDRFGIMYKSEDGSIYNEDKDGKQGYNAAGLPNWDGYKTIIKGWEITNKSDSALWIYYGCIPYNLEEGMMNLGGGENGVGNVVEKPKAISSDNNKGVLYLKAGWSNACTYKQTIRDLPKAKYRLSYWIRNTNVRKTGLYEEAKNLCNVTCNGVSFVDDEGFNSERWIQHSIDFIPVDSFTIEFGFKASYDYSYNNPILWIDGIRLFKTEEVSDDEVDEAYRKLVEIADSLSAVMHFNADKRDLQQAITLFNTDKDYVQLYHAIQKAMESENKYHEIMIENGVINIVNLALMETTTFGIATEIVQFAFTRTMEWIASDNATYLDADNYVKSLNSYANVYAPVYIQAETYKKVAGEDTALALTTLMLTQQQDLTAGYLLRYELVNEYAKALQGLIPDILFGDANCDGSVDVVDVTTVVDFILQKVVPTELQRANADVNKDHAIDVVDLTSIVSIILGTYQPANGTANYVPAHHWQNRDALKLDGTDISLLNSKLYVAFQMDVTLSDNALLNGVNLTQRANGHHVTFHRLNDKTNRIIAYSIDNTPFEDNNGILLSLNISGNQQVTITNALFTDGIAAYFLNIADATGIDTVNGTFANRKSFDLTGRPVINHKSSNHKMPCGIYVIDGKKVMVE